MNFREYLGRYRSFRDLENITKDEQNNALFRYILRKKRNIYNHVIVGL